MTPSAAHASAALRSRLLPNSADWTDEVAWELLVDCVAGVACALPVDETVELCKVTGVAALVVPPLSVLAPRAEAGAGGPAAAEACLLARRCGRPMCVVRRGAVRCRRLECERPATRGGIAGLAL
jgi:hypothetical protein